MFAKQLFRFLIASNLLAPVLPMQAALAAYAPVPEREPLLQFTAGRHVLGFAADGVYAASGSHALHVVFVGANAVRPLADTPAASDGRTVSLGKVTYADLWNGVTLAYAADADGSRAAG